jgi:hypothetical protein
MMSFTFYLVVIVVVILIAVLIWWQVKLDNKKTEKFTIDNINVLPKYKSITPEDIVKRFGGQDKVVDIFLQYKIPVKYIVDAKFYPQIASYLFNSGLQI